MIGIELTPDRPIAEIAEYATRAEEVGFDTVLASSHYNNRDPFLALSAIARATEEVSIGPAAANPYTTHPVKLASQTATLQEASDGRALLGIGAGDRSTLSNLGIEFDRPLRRVLESFRVARELWAGETVDHQGTFEARDASLSYAVDSLPVYVGAQGPQMLRMSGKHADGALVNASHPADLEWSAERIAEGLDDRPDEYGGPDEFDAAAFASVSIADDGERAREAARPPVAFIVGGAAEPVLDRHDIDPERASGIGEHLASGEFTEAFEAVTPEMIEAFAIAGTPEIVEGKLNAVLEHADSVVCGSPLGPDKEAAISLLGAVTDRCRRPNHR
ncbi:5,10-methylenetetrahydromethanopterin reductase [Halobacteriales archaeon QS_3_64_16]|nr:MAG: 5,10-methylenetetrahydromethanopterin reductase [Halobacteriales archaeon QS_3_64_16]